MRRNRCKESYTSFMRAMIFRYNENERPTEITKDPGEQE